MTFEQVELELKKIFDKATAAGKNELVLVSKDFFEQMEVKPEYRDCIPMCCKVMKSNIQLFGILSRRFAILYIQNKTTFTKEKRENETHN